MKVILFKYSICILLIAFYITLPLMLFGQKLKRTNNYEELKVGDKMPDIPFGQILNYNGLAHSFNNLRGKLVILDFWNSMCSSCQILVPGLEELQRTYPDIAIFYVDELENKSKLTKIFKNWNDRNLHIPRIPIIADAKILNQLFPHENAGHQVWIDGSGKIIARTDCVSSYPGKINEVLGGKKGVHFLKDDNTANRWNRNRSYFKATTGAVAVKGQFGGIFTSFNYDCKKYGFANVNVIDSTLGVTRSTYINQSVIELYLDAYRKELMNNLTKIIYSSNRYKGDYWKDYVQLLVKDTSKYTEVFTPYTQQTDTLFVKSRYCYEQVTPVSLSKDSVRQYEITDLNRYFKNILGCSVGLQKQMVPCYILINTSAENKLTTDKAVTPPHYFENNGKSLVTFISPSIKQILADVISSSEISQLFDTSNKPRFFIDETKFIRGNVEMTIPIPSTFKNIDDLRNSLKPYGLDIIAQDRSVNFLIVKQGEFPSNN